MIYLVRAKPVKTIVALSATILILALGVFGVMTFLRSPIGDLASDLDRLKAVLEATRR